MRNRRWAALFGGVVLLLLLACGSSREKAKTSSDSRIVGAEGGTLSLNGVELDIPAGALLGPTEITVQVASEIVSFPFQPTGSLFRLAPSGLVFNAPVTLRLPFAANSLIDPAFLRIYRAADLESSFAALSSGLLSNSSWVEGQITSLGYFSLGVPLSSIDGDSDADSDSADADSEKVETEAAGESVPDLVTHSPMDFGLVLRGQASDLTVLLANDGTGALTISSIVLATDNDPAFTMTVPGKITLAAQQTALIPVRFAPGEARAYRGGCIIRSNDPVNPQQRLDFSGRGAGGGTLSLSAKELVFPAPGLWQ